MTLSWTNIQVRLGDLRAWSDNPRLSTKKQAERLLKSFDEFGQVQTIAVSPDLEVYDGHQRLSALLTIHGKDYTVDARQSSRALTDEERRKLVIYLHSGAVGSWDWDALSGWNAQEVIGWGMDDAVLKEWKRDVTALTNLIEAEKPPTEDVEPQIDKAEELREKWGVETGQLWQLGEHRLVCGDCTDKAVVDKVMQGERAELLFTSPPYADMRTYEGDKDLSIEKLIEFIPAFRDFVNYQAINLGIKRENGEIVEYWNAYINKAKESGYKFLSWNVWNREHATTIGLQSAFFPIFHEWIFVFGVDTKEINKTQPKSEASYERQKYAKPGTRRGKDGVLRPGDKGDTSSDFVKIGTVTTLKAANTIANSLHPAMFPVELPEEYIKAITSDSDIVCEPFSGSGTTLIACENLGRKCRAIEISPAYVAVALQRWADLTGKTPELVTQVETG